MKSHNKWKDYSKSGTLAKKAMQEQRRMDSMGEVTMTGMTREQFDAIRREEEQLDRTKLNQLRMEYENDQRTIRNLAAKKGTNESKK